jgi:hypothetical protein
VRTGRTRLALCAALLLALTGSASAFGTEPAGASVSKVVHQLAPGLTLTEIRLSNGPQRIRVLTVDPTKVVMVTSTLAAPTFGTFATVGSMAASNGAIAAVNGDYGTWPERPVHSYTHDGTVFATGSLDSAFAVTADEKHSYTGSVRVHVVGSLAGSTSTFKVNTWNTGKPKTGQVAGYTAVGGSVAPPPSSGCYARLIPAGGMSWQAGRVGISRTYTVDAMKCQSSRMALNGDVLLASTQVGNGAATVQTLVPGASVTLSWTIGTWADVASSIGGGPMLVVGGKVVAPTGCGYLCSVNPRTGVGVTKTGKVLLVTVDGRNPGWSYGMTLSAFANEMKNLGSVNAMNLDGGGSTTMWTKRYGLVNKPTDCLPVICQRDVSSAILVLPKSEAGAPIAPPPAVAPAAAAAAWQQMLSDPGSTGGYMDALAGGALRGGTPTAADLRIAAAFRRSAG